MGLTMNHPTHRVKEAVDRQNEDVDFCPRSARAKRVAIKVEKNPDRQGESQHTPKPGESQLKKAIHLGQISGKFTGRPPDHRA